jgi:predicted Zn finger-like uncharacterized protein
LIVTCEQCATQFQLDDRKVPAGGVRVRCSRCKHAFFIEPPGTPPALEAPDLAAQAALDAEAPPAPEATHDLAGPGDSGQDFLDDGAGESDWEFNRAPAGDDGGESAAAESDVAGAVVDDLLGSRPAARSEGAGAESADAGSEDEDLGSPDSWDFLAEDAGDPAAHAATSEAASGAEPAARAALATPPRDPVEWLGAARPSLALLLLSRTGQTIGWCVTAVLLTLIAALTLGPALAPRAPALHGSQRLASLRAEGIAARWVENLTAGPIFVVSGRLVNPTHDAMPLGVRTGVRLLDADGARLSGGVAALGPPIPARALRESEPAELQTRQAQAGAALAATLLRPGETLPFEAVVIDVPVAATRFVIEPLPPGQAAPAAGGKP